MKYSLYLLLIVAFLFCSSNNAQAGFVVKKHITTEAVSSVKTLTNTTVTDGTGNHRSHLFSTIKLLTHPLIGYRRRPSEWVGIVAIITGLLGLFIPGVNLLAILFGVLGMGRNCRTRGLAVAGFTLGILELLLVLLAGASVTFVSLILL